MEMPPIRISIDEYFSYMIIYQLVALEKLYRTMLMWAQSVNPLFDEKPDNHQRLDSMYMQHFWADSIDLVTVNAMV